MTCNHPQYLSIEQLAEELGASVHTVRKWSARGWPAFPKRSKLPNGEVRVNRADLEAWMSTVNVRRAS